VTDNPIPFDLPARMYGLKVIVEPALEAKQWRQVRFPKSKKRRIRKKWAKRRKNWGLVDSGKPAIVQTADAIYVSPTVYAKLKRDPRLAELNGPARVITIPQFDPPMMSMTPPTREEMRAIITKFKSNYPLLP